MPRATHNSKALVHRRLGVWSAAALLLILTGRIGLVVPALAADLSAFARGQYLQLAKELQGKPDSLEPKWRFARACFDTAEFATNSTERATLAEQGIAACRAVLARDTNSVYAHYYLGLNLGQLARTRGIGALKLVAEMEKEFLAATKLSPSIDDAGPHRTLGLLYRDAPSIASVGSRSKAKHHLQKAAELAPDFPENRLNLVESYLDWGDRNGAIREMKSLDAILPEARKKLVGPAWAAAWADWDQRIARVRPRVQSPPRAMQAPRDQ